MTAPAEHDEPGRYATAGVRLLATAIDTLTIATLGTLAAATMGLDRNPLIYNPGQWDASHVATTAIIFATSAWMIRQFGATPGKLAMGLRVTGADGTSIVGWRHALLRSLPVLITLTPEIVNGVLGAGIVLSSLYWILTDPQRRSAYDRLGSTRVIRERRE